MAQYSKELGVVNNVEVGVQHGDFGVGLTRSMVEGYVMKDGKPIYNSAYTYSDQTIADVATNRDPRLTIFLKVPGQKNVFKNMSAPEDHYVIDEPYPTITTRNAENDYSTGYAIRKVVPLIRLIQVMVTATMQLKSSVLPRHC